MTSLLIQCESFRELGGWTVETQSTRQIGSSYVMAHGYGVPVADAWTEVELAEKGRYAVWARTRNWNAVWTPRAAGRFQVLVNGAPLAGELGTGEAAWHWQKAGEIDLPAGTARLALHDLTGFNGRCDALWLGCASPQGTAPSNLPQGPCGLADPSAIEDDATFYDLIVVGGGVAGTCAAIAANRLGLKVLVLQDREMLGGCNSSEVRVAMGGKLGIGPYPAIGKVVRDIQPYYGDGDPHDAKYYEDGRKEVPFTMKRDGKYKWAVPFPEADLLYRQYVHAVETDPDHPGRIAAVVARDTRSGRERRFRAPLFVDATGDAVVARLAGCETMYGREARDRFGEISAPEKADRMVMGHSIQWLSEECDAPQPFPDISDWAMPFDETTGYYVTKGSWEQETGFFRDMADDTETIRDYGLLAIFSNWHWLKNKSLRREEFANRRISWMSPIGGKRESYRVVGDYILTQVDVENGVRHDDDTAAMTWNVDLHFPDPENAAKFAEPFRSAAYHRGTGNNPGIPYRCLYARDCENLFLAGRHISCSHVAFAGVRVMRTLGQLGEVVGMAAKICRDRNCLPRDVYGTHLGELKKMMADGVPDNPTFHPGGNPMEDAFDFNRRGWIRLRPETGENIELTDAQKADILSQGFKLRFGPKEIRGGD
ncbi:MAG: FAD-dependent oxidoreductase [Kiritimatiellae bacterium]|nr:FAD-dependent oxidoreductase [Kiritimatiellia bacterium]